METELIPIVFRPRPPEDGIDAIRTCDLLSAPPLAGYDEPIIFEPARMALILASIH
jgi:hypothetical protein